MPGQKDNREISKQRLIDDLAKMGLKKGDHLGVGLSLKSIGYVDGGPKTIIEAVLEVLGPSGTLMMNAYTEFFYLTEVRRGWTSYVFDYRSTKVNTGIVPETFRLCENSIRSQHPTHSNVALGKYAKALLEGHDENSSAYLPYSRLSEINGKYLAIGIGDRLVGFRHQAQYKAGLLNVVPWKRAVNFKDRNGRIRTFVLGDRGGCVNKLSDLVAILRNEGLVNDGVIGKASAVLVPARIALERMTDLLKQQPTLNLCDRPFCLWCREIERRMNLYTTIKNPLLFQKNKTIINLIAILNWLREIDNPLIARIKLKIKKYGLFL
jgi:aminoglycoside N3'-acetyltransferase